jgi:hypothetical protein
MQSMSEALINDENLAPTMATDSATLLLGKSDIDDPVRMAAAVVDGLRTSVASVIGAGVLVLEAIGRYRGNREWEDAFLGDLVAGDVLPKAEALLGFSSPKLCKLASIGKHAGLLLRPDVFPLLPVGYSVVYGATVLFKALDGDEEARAIELARILGGCDGPLSREFLAEATKELRRKSQVTPPPVAVDPARTPAGESVDADAAATKPNDLGGDADLNDIGEEPALAGLLLLTPSSDDFRLLGETYTTADVLELALPLHVSVAPKAAVVIFGQVRDLATIQNVLLPLCGFSGRPRVLLLRRPSSPDVTTAHVVVLADRGGMRLEAIADLWDAGLVDPIAIATRLAPETIDRLHAFASTKTAGWQCRVGDETWVGGRPSL